MAALKKHDAGITVKEIYREVGISYVHFISGRQNLPVWKAGQPRSAINLTSTLITLKEGSEVSTLIASIHGYNIINNDIEKPELSVIRRTITYIINTPYLIGCCRYAEWMLRK